MLTIKQLLSFTFPVAKRNSEHVSLIQVRKGYTKAQYILGGMYYEGIGVEKNLKEAFQWIKLASDKKQADAQSDLGYLYETRAGVEKNIAKAIFWYRQAAQQKYGFGICNLAYCY